MCARFTNRNYNVAVEGFSLHSVRCVRFGAWIKPHTHGNTSWFFCQPHVFHPLWREILQNRILFWLSIFVAFQFDENPHKKLFSVTCFVIQHAAFKLKWSNLVSNWREFQGKQFLSLDIFAWIAYFSRKMRKNELSRLYGPLWALPGVWEQWTFRICSDHLQEPKSPKKLRPDLISNWAHFWSNFPGLISFSQLRGSRGSALIDVHFFQMS